MFMGLAGDSSSLPAAEVFAGSSASVSEDLVLLDFSSADDLREIKGGLDEDRFRSGLGLDRVRRPIMGLERGTGLDIVVEVITISKSNKNANDSTC